MFLSRTFAGMHKYGICSSEKKLFGSSKDLGAKKFYLLRRTEDRVDDFYVLNR